MAWVLCPVFDMLSNGANEIFNNVVQPFLYTSPISTNASDPSFKTWSQFRIYGDVFLVLALLVTVIAQSIGGGLIDAYTVKKVLPRVLVTAILINLSVYIVAFMVDITNVIGKSLGAILTSPLQAAGTYHISPGSSAASLGVFAVGLLGLFLVAGHFTGFFGALSSGKAGGAEFGKSALILAGLVLLPIFLAILAVFITLIVRKGLILFLIMISPVAFALYVLPNTEQYFKKWWDLLLEALMVYPIIVAIFAVADILAVTILSANGVGSSEITPDKQGNIALGAGHVFAVMTAFFIQFLPLLAIPFAFRMAGGTLSKLHEGVTAANGKLKQSGWYANKREHASQEYARHKATGNQEFYNRLHNAMGGNEAEGRRSWVGRRAGRFVGQRAKHYAQQTGRMSGDVSKALAELGEANNDAALNAGIYGHSYNDAVQKLTAKYEAEGMATAAAKAKAISGAQSWQATGLGWNSSGKTAAFRAAVDDGTVFSSMKEQEAAAAAVAGGDMNTLAREVGYAYAHNKSAGRHDLSDSYGSMLGRAQRTARGQTISDAEYADATALGYEGTSNTDLSRDKGKSMQNGTKSQSSSIQYFQSVADGSAADTAYARRQAAADLGVQESQVTQEQLVDYANKRVAQVVTKVDNMKASGMYYPELHGRAIQKNVVQDHEGGAIKLVHDQSQQHEVVTEEVPVTVQIQQTDAAGNVTTRTETRTETRSERRERPEYDPVTNPNGYNPTVGRVVSQEAQQRTPFDPRGPGGPLAE